MGAFIGSGSKLKKRGLSYNLSIVGGGPLRRVLEQHTRTLDVVDRMQLLDHTGDVPVVLADSSFLVLTSDSEGCPNAVMEAMACGRAVVATDVGDVPNLVDDGMTGFLVRPGDESMLEERMAKLITDRELCSRMGRAARLKAERDFGLDRLGLETNLPHTARRAGRTSRWRLTHKQHDSGVESASHPQGDADLRARSEHVALAARSDGRIELLSVLLCRVVAPFGDARPAWFQRQGRGCR